MFVVYEAEYQGEGYWADCPPLEFETRVAADDYARLVNANQQTGSLRKIREIREE